jgi:GTPase SAR1 family protein
MQLKIPKFDVDDNPLGKHLNEYPMLKHLNSYSFTGIIGKPGSGKTSLLISFLNGKGKNRIFRTTFNNLLVVMPPQSRNSMKPNIFEGHPEEKMFDELNGETINDIFNKLRAASSADENTLLILDDVGASLKNNDIQKTLKTIIYNRRHLHVHIVMLMQSFLSCPKEIRKLLTNCFLYKCAKVEAENFMAELFETHKDDVIDIMNYVYDKPHNYLMINVDEQKLYKGFDELIIHKKDEENNYQVVVYNGKTKHSEGFEQK